MSKQKRKRLLEKKKNLQSKIHIEHAEVLDKILAYLIQQHI